MEWRVSPEVVPYDEAVTFMEERVAAISRGAAQEMVWLLEHPPLYTAGSSAKKADLLDANTLPVYTTGRGGQYTYHGPGQRVAYVMIDLTNRNRDVRAFVKALEQWIIDTLQVFDITAERRCGRIGIWVDHQGQDQKIAALGVRLRRWVSFHGIAINVNPDLSHFKGIVPCGLADYGVTSCEDLGLPVTMAELDKALRQEWAKNAFLGRSPI
ncbi:MAG: lipoyl(octanoyl) transferase LipB [Alphaproteobacteria bacterium]|jgi:lipoyl(octanoyl) transferase|nr:lipoyl(octanoyl) transferase LipB [Alphaproteobacteria bacterium]